ncbi:hypothetical protein Tco_0151670 [Tanacetum coccineum]
MIILAKIFFKYLQDYKLSNNYIVVIRLILMTSWINKGEGGRKSLLRMQSKLERKINKPNCDTDREDSDGGDAHQDPNICHFEADAREVLVSSAKVILCSDSHDTGIKKVRVEKKVFKMQSKIARKEQQTNCDTSQRRHDGGDAHQ